MSEQQMQNLIISDTKKLGGFAFKLSNRFTVGIPDLFISLPNYGMVLIECKFISKFPVKKSNIDIKLTPKQRQIIRKIQQSDGQAACVIGYKFKHKNRNVWAFHVERDPDKLSIKVEELKNTHIIRSPFVNKPELWVEQMVDWAIR